MSNQLIQPSTDIRRRSLTTALETRLFRRLRPRLHPWLAIQPLAGGGAELVDCVTATRLRLNPSAAFIVAQLYRGDRTLGQIATDVGRQYCLAEDRVLADVIQIYCRLESHDATTHPFWRYWVQYCCHLRSMARLSLDMVQRGFSRWA